MSAAAGAGPRIDVVIDNYNYGRYLRQAIESVLAQDHPARLVVVDDGSSDESRAVLEELAPRIDELVLKENGGQASAVNAGLAHCEGEVVVVLDADDALEPGALARIAAAFAADPSLAKVQSRMEVIDAEGHRSGVFKPDAHLPMPNGEMAAAELAQPFDLTWLATSANAFSRAALKRLGPIPEDRFRNNADWFLVHLTPLLGPVASLQEVGALYRVHGENSYELERGELDLGHVRATIGFAAAARAELLRVAAAEGIPHPDRILSIADLSNRMISLRLDPAAHPIAGDSRLSLCHDALAACRRRRGVSALMKAMFVGWFGAMALAPRPLARPLAEWFLFPERRGGLNRLLARLHR